MADTGVEGGEGCGESERGDRGGQGTGGHGGIWGDQQVFISSLDSSDVRCAHSQILDAPVTSHPGVVCSPVFLARPPSPSVSLSALSPELGRRSCPHTHTRNIFYLGDLFQTLAPLRSLEPPHPSTLFRSHTHTYLGWDRGKAVSLGRLACTHPHVTTDAQSNHFCLSHRLAWKIRGVDPLRKQYGHVTQSWQDSRQLPDMAIPGLGARISTDVDCPLANLCIGPPPVDEVSKEREYRVGTPRELTRYRLVLCDPTKVQCHLH